MKTKVQSIETLDIQSIVYHNTLLFFSSLLLVLLLNSCNRNETINIYVEDVENSSIEGKIQAPFLHIEGALLYIVKTRKRVSQSVIVHIMKEQYFLHKELIFTPELSNVTLRGESSNNVFIYGAKKVNLQWKKYKGKIWVADISDIPDFNQLYINGTKQILARYPNYNSQGGACQRHAADVISKDRVSLWKNPIGGLVHAIHSGRWGDFDYKILGVDQIIFNLMYGSKKVKMNFDTIL